MKSAPLVFLVVMLGLNLLNYIDRYILSSNLPAIGRELIDGRPAFAGWEDSLKGILASAFMLSFMLSAPVFGWLSARMSRTKLIALGAATWSIACGMGGFSGQVEAYSRGSALAWTAGPDSGFVSALLGGFGFLLLTRCLVGVGEGAYGPAAPAILSDLFEEKQRGWVIGCFYIAIPVGGALGYILGGHLGWPDSFFWVVPPGLLLALWCWMLVDPASKNLQEMGSDVSPSRENQAGKGLLADYWRLLQCRTYLLNVIAYTACTFVVGGIAVWLPTYVIENRQAASSETGNQWIGGITVLGGLLATACGTWLAEWLSGKVRGSHMVVCGLGMLVGFPALIAVTYVPFPSAWWFVFLAIFGFFLCTGPSNTVLLNVCPARLRAPAMALCILLIHALGDTISPTIIGLISDRSAGGLDTAFKAISVLALLSGLVWLSAASTQEADVAKAREEDRLKLAEV